MQKQVAQSDGESKAEPAPKRTAKPRPATTQPSKPSSLRALKHKRSSDEEEEEDVPRPVKRQRASSSEVKAKKKQKEADVDMEVDTALVPLWDDSLPRFAYPGENAKALAADEKQTLGKGSALGVYGAPTGLPFAVVAERLVAMLFNSLPRLTHSQ